MYLVRRTGSVNCCEGFSGVHGPLSRLTTTAPVPDGHDHASPDRMPGNRPRPNRHRSLTASHVAGLQPAWYADCHDEPRRSSLALSHGCPSASAGPLLDAVCG